MDILFGGLVIFRPRAGIGRCYVGCPSYIKECHANSKPSGQFVYSTTTAAKTATTLRNSKQCNSVSRILKEGQSTCYPQSRQDFVTWGTDLRNTLWRIFNVNQLMLAHGKPYLVALFVPLSEYLEYLMIPTICAFLFIILLLCISLCTLNSRIRNSSSSSKLCILDIACATLLVCTGQRLFSHL